jgi:NADP-dependent 3-hydroxy acid dehydrogenase YdfG/acyl carrier protein
MDLESDLGIDSIKRVQVFATLRERVPGLPAAAAEELGELRTVDQAVAFLSGGGGGAAVENGAAPAAASANGVGAASVSASLLEVIAEKTGYPVEMIDPSMDLESDLGIDSIKRVQVFATLRERVPGLPAAGAEELGELRTVDQAVAFLSEAGGVGPKGRDAEAIAPRQSVASTPRHIVELTRLPRVDVIEEPYRTDPIAVLFDDGRTDAEALEAELTSRGWIVRRARHGADVEQLCTGPVDLYVSLFGVTPDWDSACRYLTQTIMVAKQAATATAPERGRVGFVTLTRLDGGLGLHGRRGAVQSLVGGVGGVVKTVAAERPSLFCRAIDVDPGVSDADFVGMVLDEIRDAAVDTREVGIDLGGARWTVVPGGYGPARHIVEVGAVPAAGDIELTGQDLLLVTGGARGVTAECVRALGAHTQARFLLLGRTELVAEPDWAVGVAEANLMQATILALAAGGTKPAPRDVRRAHGEVVAGREIRETLSALGDRGIYLAADITDAAAVEAALAEYRGQITGVVHGAGVLADAMLEKKTVEQIDRVFAPKLLGLQHVLNAIDSAPLRHIILFTSVAGLLGNPGQSDYAAANEALCRFAAGWKFDHPTARTTAIDWAAWDGGMVTPELRELFADRDVPLLGVERGATAFVEQFTAPRADDVCVLVGADAALGGLRLDPVPAFTALRDIGTIADDPIMRAHRVGSNVVFPATFGLGWLINVVERAYPDWYVVAANDFQVHKGIVFDGTPRGDYRVHVEAGVAKGDRILVRAAVRGETETGKPIPHYAAALTLATAPAQQPRLEVPPIVDGPEDALEIYREATLFHGPPLQGIRRVLDRSSEHVVVQCRLADPKVSEGAYHGRLHSPVLADLLLQGAAVLGKDLLNEAALPLGIGRAEWFAPLPDDEPFILLLDDVRQRSATITVSATAVSVDGRVLQQFNDVVLVSTKDMTEMFRESVRHWLPADDLQDVK